MVKGFSTRNLRRRLERNISLLAILLAFTFTVHAQEKTESDKAEDLSYEELSEMSLEELLNLKVTVASKRSEKISDAAGVISVLTKQELENFGGITLRDVLERVPSLTATSAYFTDRYMIASRGDQTKINGGHNLILINGRPTREIVEGGISSEILAAFPVSIIERIEVIRGPGSVLYGSNAFSCVINIVTEKSEESNLTISALAGQRNGRGAMAKGTIKAGDLRITGAGRMMRRADMDMTYNMFVFDPANPFGPPTVRSVPAQGRDEASAAFLDVEYEGLSLTGSYNQYHAPYFQYGVYENKWQKTFGNLGYNVEVSDNWSMDANVTYNYATLSSDTMPGTNRYSNDVVAEWTNHISIGEKGSIVAGGLYNYIKGREVVTTNGEPSVASNKDRGSLAFYAQADYWVANSLKLIAGAQANKVKHFKFNLVPRGGIVWYPSPRINVKGLYSEAFRAPSVNEFSMNHTYIRGDKNIKPEKVSTIDFGINYLGEKVQTGVNVFRSKHANIITLVQTFSETEFYSQYRNGSDITFRGIEWEGKYFITRSLFLTGSVLYQENEAENGRENNSTIPNFSAKGGISYNWSKGITASLFHIHQAEPDQRYMRHDINKPAGSINMLNMYLNFDVVKLFNISTNQRIAIFAQGENMLNKEIWTQDFSNVMESEFWTSYPTYPDNRGRTLYFGVTASF